MNTTIDTTPDLPVVVIAAALAGDRTAADNVELTLPETGVCSTDLGGCCDTPPQATPAATQDSVTSPAEPAAGRTPPALITIEASASREASACC